MAKLVYVNNRNCLHSRRLENDPDISIVENPSSADLIITQSTVNQLNLLHKTIYISSEPPRTFHRNFCYSNFNKFKLVVCHNPEKGKTNQIGFTDDDSAQYFPYNSLAYVSPEREITTMTNRAMFYAGKVGKDVPNYNGGFSISALRKKFGDYFISDLPGSTFIGIGWGEQSTKVNDWRNDKQQQIINSGCDFVLALENTIYPNYVSEKIWDGINSDRVTLYLGDPNIHKHVPLDCFIDLRPYYNKKTKVFNFESLSKKLKTMTQFEYDEIISRAREFKLTAVGKHRFYMDALTTKIINFIKHDRLI